MEIPVVSWFQSLNYVLCDIFPLALALRSTDSATTALPVGFPRSIRRLHRYYDAVRLLVPRASSAMAPRLPDADRPSHSTLTAGPETSQVPIRSLCT